MKGPALLAALLLASPVSAAPLGVADCVRLALQKSPRIDEVEARVRQYEARLAEVESLYYPKLSGLAYLAPMFTVDGDVNGFVRRWKSPGDWGPYTHLQALLAQPLYTFGRLGAGEEAARERALVERARVRETENAVALEVKRMFTMRLYALSMLPALRSAADTAKSALEFAEEAYENDTGEVTQTDLMKLRFALSEVHKYIRTAEYGADLAAAALKHTMGLPDDASLELDGTVLPALPEGPEGELAPALVEAAERRPEWEQLAHGKKATVALAQAEKLANAPVLFAAGTLTADWAPTRRDADNPYVYDPYNQIFGGVAVGLQFDFDPAKAAAKSDEALAMGDEVDALAAFAKTGIPLQVKKAHGDALHNRKLAELSDGGVEAARKWLAFAAAAYTTGTGEASDVLEGLVAYLQARRGYFESLQAYHIARAELDFAVGRR